VLRRMVADVAHSGTARAAPRGLRGSLWGLLTLVLLVAVSLPWLHHTFHTHARPAAGAADSTAHSMTYGGVLHPAHAAPRPAQEPLLESSVPVDDAVDEQVRALPLSHRLRRPNPNFAEGKPSVRAGLCVRTDRTDPTQPSTVDAAAVMSSPRDGICLTRWACAGAQEPKTTLLNWPLSMHERCQTRFVSHPPLRGSCMQRTLASCARQAPKWRAANSGQGAAKRRLSSRASGRARGRSSTWLARIGETSMECY
jgi:hypothetical protein